MAVVGAIGAAQYQQQGAIANTIKLLLVMLLLKNKKHKY